VKLFSGKKKSEPSTESGQEADAPTAGYQADPRKARSWFDNARTVADTGNHEYAIESFISGLKFEPDNMQAHEDLYEVAKRYRANGGKPAGLTERMKRSGGKTPVEKLLHAEFLWAKDPINPQHALATMEHAHEAGLDEVAYWVGEQVLDINRAAKKSSKQIYLSVRDIYADLEAWDKAVEACQLAVHEDPHNANLIKELRNLQAENTLMQGGYGGEEGGFRGAIKDADKQKALEQEEQIAKTDDVKQQVIDRLEAEYEDDPEDTTRMEKLVRALREKEEKQAEDRAIELLKDAHEKTGQYRYKMQVGDIVMKQYNRALRDLNQQLQDKPDDEELKQKLRRLATAQVKFERDEYAERVKNYPTDSGLKFQLGRRQLALKQYDEAIASFQDAQSDPKHRSAALRYLGQAFQGKAWSDEAIDTFRRGIEAHGNDSDRVALELRYDLMDALEKKARDNRDSAAAQEASKLASQIAQTNISFKDVRDRVNKLRGLVEELKPA